MKLPTLNFKLPKFFKWSHYQPKHSFLYRIWKTFLNQIPREFRSAIKSHKHFLVLGDEKSGKTDLIRSVVEQGQNIYPFEAEYVKDTAVQFYLGPKQIVQELSISVVKDRTIQMRKSLIHLWKRLYAKNPPLIVIAYNCFQDVSRDVKEVNKVARLIAGKLSLLSEISKEPLKIRIVLTHLDQLDGYLEFARFIKQHGIMFDIPLSSNFESEALKNSLDHFRDKYLSLILTSTSADDFIKILKFLNELPAFFSLVEEFLRVLTTNNISGQLELENLTFTTNAESYTAFLSFDWTASVSNSIFFRHPILKHQMTSAAIVLVSGILILNNFMKDRLHVHLTKQGIDSLVYLQPKVFVDEVIPQIEYLLHTRPQRGYLPFLPRFYKQKLHETNQHLAMRIRKHILEPNLRKMMLTDQPELKILYMLGLMHSTCHNRLGHHILKHLSDWSQVLELDEILLKTYIFSSLELNNHPIEIEGLAKINVSVPLTSPEPWIDFLTRFAEISNQPVFIGHNLEDLRKEASHLLVQYRRIKHDTHAFVICNLLRESSTKILSEFAKNLHILTWLEQNSDLIENFLVFIFQTSPPIPDITDLNISQFFAKLKDISALTNQENRSYNFILGDEKFSFDTNKWVTLSVTHIIERLIHSYIVANNDTQGEIFFRHTPVLPNLVFQSYRNEFPFFEKPLVIDGYYSRLAFEKNVRFTAESLLRLLETMPINAEDRDRFTRFIQQEVVSYAKQYQQEYERIYAASNIRSSTLEEAKEILERILETSSSFQHFLHTLTHHTEVFSNPPACLNVLEEMNHFNFLRSLMSDVKNKKSPFANYQAILANVLAQIRESGAVKNQVDSHTLEDHLTPAARITLSILRNEPNSCLSQITETLTEIGVPASYHHLFTAPIMQVYHLGIKDLKKGIDKLWVDFIEPQTVAFFIKRPFNPKGELLATFEEVKKMTNPMSEFWGMIKQIATPVSLYSNGIWSPHPSAGICLDSAFYATLNRLDKISHILWDNEGNPQPLQIQVQSLPFECNKKEYPTPILSYLVTGEESFHNFNQNPNWYPLKIDWWKENNSTIVVELINKNDKKSYRDEKALNTLWSFFELLEKGQEKESNLWQWELGNKLTDKTSTVALRFATNPWAFFQLDNLSKMSSSSL